MKQYGLLGQTLSHSYSPRLHQLFGNPAYQLYEKAPQEVAAFLQKGDFSGLNVTIPYKKTVLPFCQALSATAQAIGSVNTLVRQPDGSLYGDNTDAAGFAALLDSLALTIQGKKALVFGSGGASATVRYVLRQRGAHPVVISRSGENHYQNLFRHQDAALLVNATPVGMYPHSEESPVELSQFPHCEAVLDLVYNPGRTRLLCAAQERGIPHRGGLLMLVEQARQSILRWQPQNTTLPSTLKVLEQIQREMSNIILIGMPGCGKTTLGRRLAQILQRSFFDSDEEIVKRTGMPIPEFFRRYGEAAFRAEETAVLKQIGKTSGAVIATGGGCVLRSENYLPLHQNGHIIFLQRELEKLDVSGRPLSLTTELAAIYALRQPYYQRFADSVVENTTSLQQTLQKIWEIYNEAFHYQWTKYQSSGTAGTGNLRERKLRRPDTPDSNNL